MLTEGITTARSTGGRRLFGLFAVIFLLSGASSLIYQVAWQRLLTLYYGVGSISNALIVSVYMFGLGLGALAGGAIADRSPKRVSWYAAIETLLGCFGLISLPFLSFLGDLTAGVGYGATLTCIFAFLAVPTILMGMTLPILTKAFNSFARDFLKSLGLLYFVNTLGAALGAIVAGYLLLSFFGIDAAIYTAAAINVLLATALFALRRRLSGVSPALEGEDASAGTAPLSLRYCYLLVFCTGFLAIGYEVTWLRAIGVLVKDSPYAFCTILAVYLFGIAFGSLGVRHPAVRRRIERNTLNTFVALQALLGAYVFLSFIGYFYLTKDTSFGELTNISFAKALHPPSALPAFDWTISSLKELHTSIDIFLWPLLFVFPPTVLMGASFPLASSLAFGQSRQEGRSVGGVYFWNIAGNVLGGLVTGFLLLPLLGTERVLAGFSAIGVAFLFIPRTAARDASSARDRRSWIRRAAVFSAVVAGVWLFPGRHQLYQLMHGTLGVDSAAIDEGVEGVVVTVASRKRLTTYINGQAHGGRPGYSFYNEAIEALAFAPRVRSILVIGYGTGSIVEAALKAEDVESVTLVEINATLMENLGRKPLFEAMLSDPRVEYIHDDGRRFLLGTDRTFDLVLIDPLRTTTSHSNNLYSLEFFQLVKERLNPGGIFLVWMDEFRVLPATVAAAFSYVRSYAYFNLGSTAPLTINDERKTRLLAKFSPEDQQGIAAYAAKRPYRMSGSEIRAAFADYPINRDWRPICEYYLGLHYRYRTAERRAAEHD